MNRAFEHRDSASLVKQDLLKLFMITCVCGDFSRQIHPNAFAVEASELILNEYYVYCSR